MASRLPKFLYLLLLLFVLQVLMAMVGEAAVCESPSRLFNGACFRSSNCGTICEKEGFLNGRCKFFFRCICSKDCNGGGGGGSGGGGGGDGPPGEDPPEGPPDDGGNGGGDEGGDGGDEGGDGDAPTQSARPHQNVNV